MKSFLHLASLSGYILEAANCTFDNVVKTTVLLADINDFGAVNEVYTKFFSSNYPARAAYQVSRIYYWSRINIFSMKGCCITKRGSC